MTITGRILAGTALAGMATLGMSHGALATPYAFASNQITGLIVTYGDGTRLSAVGATQNVADSASFGAYPAAAFHGTGPVGTALTISQAFSGPGPVPAVSYNPLPVGSFVGARGDADIGKGSAVSGGVDVDNVGESYGHQLGNSNGNNSATIHFSVTLSSPDTIKLTFADAINLIASTAAFPGETATASITNTFSVTPSTGGSPVFSCAPPDLNQQLSSIGGVPLTNSVSNSNSYTCTTGVLPVGTYNISLSSGSTVSTIPAAVPEPASLAVLGAGLLGLGLAVRRRQAQ